MGLLLQWSDATFFHENRRVLSSEKSVEKKESAPCNLQVGQEVLLVDGVVRARCYLDLLEKHNVSVEDLVHFAGNNLSSPFALGATLRQVQGGLLALLVRNADTGAAAVRSIRSFTSTKV